MTEITSHYAPSVEEPEEEHGEPLPGPEARADIVSRLRVLANYMAELAADMEYHGGFGPMGIKAGEMQRAVIIVSEWADVVEAMA